ncbi:uncharacterized protein LOC112181217 [Rosa chinensis]|uniref:uncharacterized protein LOC112181217 n=1 Tax=Rosa chinensis TaxID=74649 RepID=UPI000D089D94|nr:uncharacterized protein LOC112181217 [Rosa chinensis]
MGQASERGIDLDTQCPLCDEEIETPLHAVRDCPHASSLFQGANLPLFLAPTSVADWLLNRNAKVWEGDFQQASQIVPLTLGWLEEYKAALSSTRSGLAASLIPRWKKPPMGFVKLNVDAAFYQVSGHSGLGGVFRDHD